MLLQPSLLLLLRENDSHGYEIYDQLSDFGFDMDCLDSSIVYRDLREMEKQGLIGSYWDERSKGPKKRVYQINGMGEERLLEWIELLNNQQERISFLIRRYQKNK
jgi:poly-beta-hydroxybutyrate-responsive repressor